MRRVLLATSEDGETFTRVGEPLLDQTNMPSAVRWHDAVLVYSTMYKLADDRDGTAVSARDDARGEWHHYAAVFEDVPVEGAHIVESYAVVLPDDRIRLYFGAVFDGVWGIHSAVSSDAFTFVYEGESVLANGGFGDAGGYVDPLVAWGDGLWHIFVTDSSNATTVHGTSADGLRFEFGETVTLEAGGKPQYLTHWLRLGDGFRIFASNADGTVGSLGTSDGETLEAEEGSRLEPEEGDLESDWVGDAAVVSTDDGGYLMVYVTEIPE